MFMIANHILAVSIKIKKGCFGWRSIGNSDSLLQGCWSICVSAVSSYLNYTLLLSPPLLGVFEGSPCGTCREVFIRPTPTSFPACMHVLIIIIIIIIIIIAFKGAIRDFLQSPRSAANRLQHARSSGPGAIVCKSHAAHRALIMCNMLCYVPLGTKGQLSY